MDRSDPTVPKVYKEEEFSPNIPPEESFKMGHFGNLDTILGLLFQLSINSKRETLSNRPMKLVIAFDNAESK